MKSMLRSEDRNRPGPSGCAAKEVHSLTTFTHNALRNLHDMSVSLSLPSGDRLDRIFRFRGVSPISGNVFPYADDAIGNPAICRRL
jgi:hypothetical protein